MLFNMLRFLLNYISGYKMAFKNESIFHFSGDCFNFYFISFDFSVRIFTVTRRSPELSCNFFSFEIFFFFLQFLIENLKSLCLSVWSLKCNCFISACISKHFPKHLLKGHLAFGEDAVTLTINETKCSEPVPQKYSMIDVWQGSKYIFVIISVSLLISFLVHCN